ncbi:hypothetical protein [Lactobacillus sp.]|uniref:hypothetical protein n=1 Tax=Lactobacillus sp. TaxID=1591 RepID=UPI003EFA30CA
MTDKQSMIAVQEKDNTITSLLLDRDGELEKAGKTLLDHYQDYETVLNLVNLGDLKTLGDSPEQSYAYARDGHDDLIKENYPDIEVFDRATDFQDDYLDYCYLYCKFEGEFMWLVRDCSADDRQFKPLKDLLK